MGLSVCVSVCLVIDNMDDLPPLVFDTAAHDVAQLSRTLIHFLLTRPVVYWVL